MQSSHMVNVSELFHTISGLMSSFGPSPRLRAMKRCGTPIWGAEMARPQPFALWKSASVACSRCWLETNSGLRISSMGLETRRRPGSPNCRISDMSQSLVCQLGFFVQSEFESEKDFGSAVGKANAIPIDEVARAAHDFVDESTPFAMDSRPRNDDPVARFEFGIWLFCEVTHESAVLLGVLPFLYVR